jgi:hypothetical protein
VGWSIIKRFKMKGVNLREKSNSFKTGLAKTRLKKKNQPGGFFLVLLGFIGFFGFYWGFYMFVLLNPFFCLYFFF